MCWLLCRASVLSDTPELNLVIMEVICGTLLLCAHASSNNGWQSGRITGAFVFCGGQRCLQRVEEAKVNRLQGLLCSLAV